MAGLGSTATGIKRRIMKGRNNQPRKSKSAILRQREEQQELDIFVRNSLSQQEPPNFQSHTTRSVVAYSAGSASFSSKVQGAMHNLMSQQSAKISCVQQGECCKIFPNLFHTII